VLLDQPDTAANIARFSHAGRVPVLLAGEMTIWDSLAICEYLAEQFPEKHLWPQDVAARAMARSVVCEMHSGFTDLRSAMSMNIKARLPGRGRTPGAQADIGRICEIWEECLSRFGHHRFLFGEFSIADAFYAPVVMRFKTYGVALAPALQAYCDRMLAHPAVARWVEEALAETEIAAGHEDELPD
jgi:glutathione S-transferase